MSEKPQSAWPPHSADFPFASVIIPVKDGFERLQLCLTALLAQDYPADRFEIIVVDNGSASSPAQVMKIDPRIKLLEERQPGSYRARNLGLGHAKGEIIAFTDADCVPAVGWLFGAVRYMVENPSVDMLGGRVTLFYSNGAPVNGPEWFEFVEGFPQERYVRNGFAVTANMVTRRSVFDRVGPFDGSLLSGGDAAWGRRVRDHGGRQEYGADVVVEHPARDTWQELKVKTVRTTGGVARRTWAGPRPRIAFLRLIVGQFYRSAKAPLMAARRPGLPSIAARRRYLATRWRVDLVIVATLLRALLTRP